MNKKVVLVCVIILVMGVCSFAHANSYLEMITEPPENYEEPESDIVDDVEMNAPSKTNLWYDSRIKTQAPVVVSPYPRYYAWLRSKANEGREDNTHEQIQNLIYIMEGGLAGWGLYEIYRYKH